MKSSEEKRHNPRPELQGTVEDGKQAWWAIRGQRCCSCSFIECHLESQRLDQPAKNLFLRYLPRLS